MSPSLTRRQVAKGAVWATPVVVATAAVPAYAGSKNICTLDAGASLNTGFEYGDKVVDANTNRTTEYFTLDGGGMDVYGLDADETVTSLSVTLSVENANSTRTAGNNQGFDDPTQNTVNVDDSGLGPGWTQTSAARARTTTINLEGGGTTTRNMWSVTFTNDPLSSGSYSTDANGCKTFISSDIVTRTAGYALQYPNMVAFSGGPGNIIVTQVFTYTATTSKGNTIVFQEYFINNDSINGVVKNIT
ncbi:Uncharacterised protein [Mycobacteroides abscessus subsp. abscessus]|nr:Uncharacterised protein [Mycobacteroides abscessus subsp. abscessus]